MLISGRTGRAEVRGSSRSIQSGLSLVELLVGIAVGLLVVAAAAMLTASQLSDNRRLLLETQVQQDLRAAMDTITREGRRAGARIPAYDFVSTPEHVGTITLTGVEIATPLAGSATQLNYKYNRFGMAGGTSGFRLSGTRVQFRLPSVSTWSDLTDVKALTVTHFSVDANHQDEPMPGGSSAEQRIPCPKLCAPANDTSCWPVVKVREYVVSITATAASDPAVARTMNTIIRPRNNQLVVASGIQACPA
jgi:type IV pilus assembly protein PilW